MIQRLLLASALIVLAVLSTSPGVAFADLATSDLSDATFPIPEPSTLTLVGSGIAALAGIGWFRRHK